MDNISPMYILDVAHQPAMTEHTVSMLLGEIESRIRFQTRIQMLQ